MLNSSPPCLWTERGQLAGGALMSGQDKLRRALIGSFIAVMLILLIFLLIGIFSPAKSSAVTSSTVHGRSCRGWTAHSNTVIQGQRGAAADPAVRGDATHAELRGDRASRISCSIRAGNGCDRRR